MNLLVRHGRVMVAIKICGMTDLENIAAVARLTPDYLGFICWNGSPRFVGEGFSLPRETNPRGRVGVFVNQDVSEICTWQARLNFSVVQLHGDESPEFCAALRNALPDIRIWKSFAISDSVPDDQISGYLARVDALLFDTKGVMRGGSGKSFPWQLIERYAPGKPLILSGGLGIENIRSARELCTKNPSIVALDFNSRLELAPGLKDIGKVAQIISAISEG